MKFDVLGTQRAIRDDKSLSTSQFALLMAAVLRTDNKTCKVRYSIDGLGKDANTSERTARTAFNAPKVLKYMAKVEGRTRAKNMWFHPIPAMVAGMETGHDSDSGNYVHDSGNCVHDSGNCVHDSGNGCTPSTYASTSPSTNTTGQGPVEQKENEVREEDEVSGYPLTDEATSYTLPNSHSRDAAWSEEEHVARRNKLLKKELEKVS